MVWSYSRVKSYETCPKAFFLQYIEKLPTENNAFGQWGSYIHKILEMLYKNELSIFELSDYYITHYRDEITCRFPPNKYKDLNKSYYQSGVEYLDEYDGLSERYDVLGVEEKVNLDIGGYRFVGIIDLILQEKDTGNIIIRDHKSKSKFKDDAEKDEYLIQLYLYARHIKEKYGKFPTKLQFNMFRAGELVEEIFNEDAYNAAADWFITTIQKIYKDAEYKDKIFLEYKAKGKLLKEYKYPDFFCEFLCGVRNYCNRSEGVATKRSSTGKR